MKKVGILGGTFDPPHIAHFVIAQEVLEQCKLDEIWFMPVNIPPHKKRPNLSSAHDRVKMLELGIKKQTKFSICTIELNRTGKSYTVDTMEQLISLYPDYEFYFIIGADMVEQLHTWYKINRLMELVIFIGTKRPGYKLNAAVDNLRMIEVEVPQLEISSSMLRERLKNNQSIDYLVPDEVKEYIKENQLYGAKTSIENC